MGLACLSLAGCSSIEHKPLGFAPGLGAPPALPPQPGSASQAEAPTGRKIAIFFDGTANDEGSDTNVKRLHSLVTLQNRGDIASLYLHGVGVNFDVTGAATGAGINARVRIAYEFVRNHYRPAAAGQPADQIFIFGFSRGAYAARILTSMLYHAGMVRDVLHDAPGQAGLERQRSSAEVAEAVHGLVFPEKRVRHGSTEPEIGRRARVQAGLAALHLRADGPPVPVQVLGLWDTVEALGAPSWPQRLAHKLRLKQLAVNVDVPNERYGDKLCNVVNAYHAVSIDDNRAWIFTPLLLTRKHLFDGCGAEPGLPRVQMHDKHGRLLPGSLQEVWFSGAHSDVGGGYLGSGLSGVSLNWMIERLAHTDLLPRHAAVRSDTFGSSHDPEAGLSSLLYHAINRDVLRYALDTQALPAVHRTVCVHPSVLQRRQRLPPKDHENQQLPWTARGHVFPRQEPNPRDAGWPWYTVREGQPGPAEHAVEIQEYPRCATMSGAPSGDMHAP